MVAYKFQRNCKNFDLVLYDKYVNVPTVCPIQLTILRNPELGGTWCVDMLMLTLEI